MASNVENILRATIDGTTYEVPANSRVEELLIELKEVIEAGGGGGGGTTNYNALSNKPKINSIELSGNKSLSDLSLYSKSEVDIALAAKANTTDVDTALGNKVDKVNDKGLSENDYTDAEKTKLSNIESEANKTIVDNTLSTTSTNPVQNKVINIALSGKQDTISDLENIRTGAGLGATAVQPSDMEEALDDKVDKVEGKGLSTNDFTNQDKEQITTNKNGIAAVANVSAKNLLDYTFSINGDKNARITNGVTFTINADGSISTSGTASSNVTAAWIQKDYVVPNDPVILSGCPAGGADDTYRIDILDGTPTGSGVAFDYGNGAVIKSSMFTNGIGIIRIRIEKGQNVDGLVFRPMVRPASITDDTYVPYAPTNRELYEMILALQAGT